MKKLLLLSVSMFLTLHISAQRHQGFFDFEYNDSSGTVILEVPASKINKAFLYVHSLASGIGSNDIGLDRGQLGGERVVHFEKAGDRLLLYHENLRYRAVSDNPDEVKAVRDAFANAVLWGFKIIDTTNQVYKIDISKFLMYDRHQVAYRLKELKQGSYKVDASKSAIYMENTKSFPKNSEFESVLTFVGKGDGRWIQEVSADENIISVRQHHSFIELPDDGYKPRVFHPSSGYYPLRYEDYASPIGTDMSVRLITRHRLEKKNPTAARSEAKEPIVYYLDRGCPEPVKSALLEGGRWWNQAFEAAGFINAFRVEMLPEGADPLDVRYNVIQWVHRKTRGWSYGSSVTDPRTGEILKGHVSLGSLRVRQDYLIAQGILSKMNLSLEDDEMLEMALARLRQLSAHEIGHTIGLSHNFAASYNDRASVMDYPHPLITVDQENNPDLSSAYAVDIGAWDKRAVIYGYSSIPEGEDERIYLNGIIKETESLGYKYISDPDARPKSGLHPHAHLWDNGQFAVGELTRLSNMRRFTLNRMGEESIAEGQPYSELANLLVPSYLMHRYQVEAVSKLIGGLDYTYAMKGDSENHKSKLIPVPAQEAALNSLLNTLSVKFLSIPDQLLEIIPPPAYGYGRTRESFSGNTGLQFDPIAAAEASSNHSLEFMLDPSRLSRLLLHDQKNWKLADYLDKISEFVFSQDRSNLHALMVEKLYFIHLLKLSQANDIDKQVAAIANKVLGEIKNKHLISKANSNNKNIAAHSSYLIKLHNQSKTDIEKFKIPQIAKMPPGSPIGCDR